MSANCWKMILGPDTTFMFQFLIQHGPKESRNSNFNGLRVYGHPEKPPHREDDLIVCIDSRRKNFSLDEDDDLPPFLTTLARAVMKHSYLWPLFLLSVMNDPANGWHIRPLFQWGDGRSKR